MKKPSTHAIRRSLDALERRDVPALFPVTLPPIGELAILEPIPDYASITFANGTVSVTGTQADDFIKVHTYTPVFTLRAGLIGGEDWVIRGEQTVVTVMDAAGNVRTDANGAPLRHTFNSSSVNLIQASGQGGHDRIVNLSDKFMVMGGGEGNDTLAGGAGKDIMNGGGGHDSLTGGAGDDVLAGLTGNDRMSGDAGNDVVQGGDDFDILDGGADHDTMDGEGGTDIVVGGAGNDTLIGWDGNDVLSGGAGNDSLDGGAGNDAINGDAGDDTVRGGVGNDDLHGGADDDLVVGDAGLDILYGDGGNDGVFGGANDGVDTLYGGAGADRFLMSARKGSGQTAVREDLSKDATSADARPAFVNGYQVKQTDAEGNTFTYTAKNWTDADVLRADAVLALLHREAGGTRLLKRSGGGDMGIVRHGTTLRGFNDGWIHMTDSGIQFGGSDTDLRGYLLHEIGHYWQGSAFKSGGTSYWNQFKGLSGWTSTDPRSSAYTRSTNEGRGDRWYLTSAGFVSDYAKTNENEDFAESFAAFFTDRAGWTFYGNEPGAAAAPDKMTVFAQWLAGL